MSSYSEQLTRVRALDPSFQVGHDCEKGLLDGWLAKHPELKRPLVLDAGCGFQYGLISRYPGRFDVLGIDLDPDVLARNRDVTWKVRADTGVLPLRSASFDVILSSYVLEHLAEPQACLAEFARVLKPGGAVVLTTVNVRNPGMWAIRLTPLWLRAAVREASFGKEHAENSPTFYRANTPARVRRLAEGAGLIVEHVVTWPNFFWYFRFAPPILYALALVNRLLAACGLRSFFGGMTFALTRPTTD